MPHHCNEIFSLPLLSFEWVVIFHRKIAESSSNIKRSSRNFRYTSSPVFLVICSEEIYSVRSNFSKSGFAYCYLWAGCLVRKEAGSTCLGCISFVELRRKSVICESFDGFSDFREWCWRIRKFGYEIFYYF